MGVKSTKHLTHEEALLKLGELRLQAKALSDTTELENELERLNDLVHGGEGFENYSIVSQAEKERLRDW
jgi:hypothetical protein